MTEPRCDKGHPMRAIEAFKFGHEKGDSERDTESLRWLESQGLELTGETWVLWYCERCDLAIAQPAPRVASDEEERP